MATAPHNDLSSSSPIKLNAAASTQHLENVALPSHSNYIAWNAKGVEVVGPGEAAMIQAVSDQFSAVLFLIGVLVKKLNLNNNRRASAQELPGAPPHVPRHSLENHSDLVSQGCVKGTFTIKSDLPEHLAQGMFKTPGKSFSHSAAFYFSSDLQPCQLLGTHDMIMRYSSLTPKILPDTAGAPRGIGFKVFGVKGEKIWGEDKQTQDFTANNYPLLELRTPKVTNEIADSLDRNFDNLGEFVEELKKRDDADVACYAGGLAQEHMAAMDEFSQSAYRYGKYVAKYGIFPVGDEQKALKTWSVKSTDPHNILSTTLRDFHMNHKATYSFRVQLLQDLDAQPVEDIGISQLDFTSAGLPEYSDCFAIILDDLFTRVELSRFLAAAELSAPWDVAGLNATADISYVVPSHRNGERIILHSETLSKEIFERVKLHLGGIEKFEEERWCTELDRKVVVKKTMVRSKF
ncbi:hypothetical protein P7C70_g2708, partial [Phenoliferia sp. Uapishka_3]